MSLLQCRVPAKRVNSSTVEQRILIIGPSWVGDMVMAQSLFKAIKQQRPEWLIDVLAPTWSQPLLERMPEVDRAWQQPLGHGKLDLPSRYTLGKVLREPVYQQAIVLPNSWKSAIPVWVAGIPQRTGYVGEFRYGLLNDTRRLNKNILRRTVERFVALADDVTDVVPNILPPRLVINHANSLEAMTHLELNADKPILALCAGAEYGEAKRWPEHYYAELAQNYIDKGGQVWLFGSEKDYQVGANIKRKMGANCHNLCGRTALADALDLMALAEAVVSNDSGLMHVAAALDKPLVAIYGSSDPNFTPPLHTDAHIASLNLKCSPCFKRVCPLEHLRCLHDLTPQIVQNKLQLALAKSAS
jgi:heptosyltransferase-2